MILGIDFGMSFSENDLAFGTSPQCKKGFDFTSGAAASSEGGVFPIFQSGRLTPPSQVPFVFGSTSHQGLYVYMCAFIFNNASLQRYMYVMLKFEQYRVD